MVSRGAHERESVRELAAPDRPREVDKSARGEPGSGGGPGRGIGVGVDLDEIALRGRVHPPDVVLRVDPRKLLV
jgi:hypothetical protein